MKKFKTKVVNIQFLHFVIIYYILIVFSALEVMPVASVWWQSYHSVLLTTSFQLHIYDIMWEAWNRTWWNICIKKIGKHYKPGLPPTQESQLFNIYRHTTSYNCTNATVTATASVPAKNFYSLNSRNYVLLCIRNESRVKMKRATVFHCWLLDRESQCSKVLYPQNNVHVCLSFPFVKQPC